MVPEQITVRARTVVTEIAAAGALIGSYPLDWLVRRGEAYFCAPSSEPVILIHGFGGGRSNLLALAAYLRLAGFDNVSYFEYPRWQTLGDSAAQLGRLVPRKNPAAEAFILSATAWVAPSRGATQPARRNAPCAHSSRSAHRIRTANGVRASWGYLAT